MYHVSKFILARLFLPTTFLSVRLFYQFLPVLKLYKRLLGNILMFSSTQKMSQFSFSQGWLFCGISYPFFVNHPFYVPLENHSIFSHEILYLCSWY